MIRWIIATYPRLVEATLDACGAPWLSVLYDDDCSVGEVGRVLAALRAEVVRASVRPVRILDGLHVEAERGGGVWQVRHDRSRV